MSAVVCVHVREEGALRSISCCHLAARVDEQLASVVNGYTVHQLMAYTYKVLCVKLLNNFIPLSLTVRPVVCPVVTCAVS